MLKNYLKIAWRAARKSGFFTVLNVTGLAIAFTGFILAYAYINYENSYDQWNPDLENIYLVGIEINGKASNMTPASLSPAINAQLPEIEESGRTNRAPYEVPFLSDDIYFIKNWVGADRSIARIFDIEAEGLSIQNPKGGQTTLVTQAVARKLFPTNKGPAFTPQKVMLASEQSGLTEYIHGIAQPRGRSIFTYECIGFKDDIADGRTGDIFETYIQVKPGTDIRQLREKINAIYRRTVSKERDVLNTSLAIGQIYLDPLKNLHLRPRHGSSIGYKITVVLGVLSAIILLLAGINFANLMVVQAQKRAKEIGVRKILGVYRTQLIFQFLTEVFVQCICAVLIAACLVTLGWNIMITYFGYEFSAFSFDSAMIKPLGLAILLTVIISGLYPAVVLSAYNPITIIKGNFQVSLKAPVFRTSLLVFQFVIACVFISVMLVINQQMMFIKNSDKGFNASQVLYIKNLAIFNKPGDFTEVRNRMKEIPGVISTTVATNIPGGIPPRNQEFSCFGRPVSLAHIAVDYEYFETLGIRLIKGRLFSSGFPADTLNSAIINEAAFNTLALKTSAGTVISGCGEELKVIGVVKDSKMQGFEHFVQPTIYTIKNTCNVPKVEIMAMLSVAQTGAVLSELEKQWSSINKRDGNHFTYEFVDEKYARLYSGQEKLQQAFTSFTVLIILVALMGLFSMSAFAISLREKEVGVRKVLGASVIKILILLNRPFLKVVSIAVLIATPIAWWGSTRWLETFTYRVDLPWWIFAATAVLALVLVSVTVTYQALKAALINPIKSLRTE